MDKNKILEIINKISELEIIKQNEIPDLDLYMDQVTTFAEERLKDYKRIETDKILTKTMINNYTKDKIIHSPIKKKYSKEHIISLIMIYHLKSILSIGDINKLFSLINEENTRNIYNEFLKIQEYENKNIEKEIKAELEKISEEDTDIYYLLLIMQLIYQANIRKQIAEKIIDLL